MAGGVTWRCLTVAALVTVILSLPVCHCQFVTFILSLSAQESAGAPPAPARMRYAPSLHATHMACPFPVRASHAARTSLARHSHSMPLPCVPPVQHAPPLHITHTACPFFARPRSQGMSGWRLRCRRHYSSYRRSRRRAWHWCCGRWQGSRLSRRRPCSRPSLRQCWSAYPASALR